MGKLSAVLEAKTPYSVSKFDMTTKSDGEGAVIYHGKKPKPTTEVDQKIHLGHIVGSGWYNLDHDHDHTVELAFDYNRLHKEDPKLGEMLQKRTTQILGPIFKKMNLKLSKVL